MLRWLIAWSQSGDVEMVGVFGESAEEYQAEILRETGCRSAVIEAPDIWAALESVGEIEVMEG